MCRCRNRGAVGLVELDSGGCDCGGPMDRGKRYDRDGSFAKSVEKVDI